MLGCAWHGRITMCLAGWTKQRDRMVALASASREGDVSTRFARHFGVGTIRGSAGNPLKRKRDKGGASAYRQLVQHLQSGGCAVINPDGPGGPRMRAGEGVVRLARDAGVPLVPFTWSTRGKTILRKAWDYHCLPHFFTRGVMIWGDPIHVDPEADDAEIDRIRRLMEKRLNAMTADADRLAGGEVIEPDVRERRRVRSAV